MKFNTMIQTGDDLKLSQGIKVEIDNKYFRAKFKKVIDDWYHDTTADKKELLDNLMKCFEDEK